MKELSIEEKARLYDEAIKRAREFVCKDNVEVAEYIFPELKESEDWIPKEIIKYLKEKGDFRSCWIAWLERQGEKESIVLKFREGDVIEYKSKQWTIIGVDLDNHCYDMSNDECVDFDTAYYAFKLVEKKPKFHEGQWIVQENIGVYKIIEVCESWYEVIDTKDNHYSISFDKEYMCHLWTIADVKDGDVLACKSGWTCIFKTLVNDETFSSYCFMDNTKWFCDTGSECHTLKEEFVKAYNGKIYPATKEQRDLLFQKMKEAGYEFDFEKKELKKIEQKPTWSEKDEEIIIKIGEYLNRYGNYIVESNEEKAADVYKSADWLKSLKDRANLKNVELISNKK